MVLFFLIGLTPLPHSISATNLLQNDFNYKINSSVRYRIESNFTLHHFRQEPHFYEFKNVIIDYQEYKSGTSDIKIPHQVNSNRLNKSEGPKVNTWIETDEFGNGFYIREVNLSKGESVSILEEYEIELNQIELNINYDINMEAYTRNDKIHALYCNNIDAFYQGRISELKHLSNAISENETNPMIIVQKIMSWISENVTYGKKDRTSYWSYPYFGAIETYYTKKGVCRDYAELMVTLLRIQNIPARIVKGFVLDNSRPVKGDIFEFHTYRQNESFGGNRLGFHVWIEYYVPNLGWLSCDPTWSDSGITYFNTLDCIHFHTASGSWFSMPYNHYLVNDDISFVPLKFVPVNSCNYDFTFLLLTEILSNC